MSELGTGAVAFACVFGGTLGGLSIRAALPEHHRTKDTEDAVKLGMGVIATMGALVVGLLLASAGPIPVVNSARAVWLFAGMLPICGTAGIVRSTLRMPCRL